METNIKKCYNDYDFLRKSLINKTHNLSDDSIGQYNSEKKENKLFPFKNTKYSIDITVKDYDGVWCIDYDVYDITDAIWYLDGGRICKVSDLPETDEEFWQLIAEKSEQYIQNL